MRRWGYVVGAATIIAGVCASACASIVSLDSIATTRDGGTSTTSEDPDGTSSSGSTSGDPSSSGNASSSGDPSSSGTTTSTSSGSSTSSSGTVDAGPPPPTDPQTTCANDVDCQNRNKNNRSCDESKVCVSKCSKFGDLDPCRIPFSSKGTPCCLGATCTPQGSGPLATSICE